MKRKEYYALRALEVTRCPYGDAPTELLEELVQDAAAIARDRILLELALLGGKVPGDPIRGTLMSSTAPTCWLSSSGRWKSASAPPAAPSPP